MPAPTGNKFWELRSTHGRKRIFETPDIMWKAACEYFEWCEKNPFIHKEAKIVGIGDYQSKIEYAELPKMRAFTMEGLCRYLDCNTKYFADFERSIADKTDDLNKDFLRVIIRIREVIFEQKFTGAAAGFLQHTIIAMEIGLKSKNETELSIPGVTINLIPKK